MKRTDKHELFMKMALDVAGRSTCARVQVGAVMVKNQRVVSMGWNGVPSGKEHCHTHFEKKFEKLNDTTGWSEAEYQTAFSAWMNTPEIKEEHHAFAVRNEVHSEMNAMIFAAKHGIALDGADVYVVWSPCIDCAKALLQVGIVNCYYNKLYERDTRGVDFLQENGVNCVQVKTAD